MSSISDVFKAVEAGKSNPSTRADARSLIKEAQARQRAGQKAADKQAKKKASDEAAAAAELVAAAVGQDQVAAKSRVPAKKKAGSGKKSPAAAAKNAKKAGSAPTTKAKSKRNKARGTKQKRREGAVTTHAPSPAPVSAGALERPNGPGVVTRGVAAMWQGMSRSCSHAAHWSTGAWLLVSACLVTVVLLVVAETPPQIAAQGVDFVGQDNPPPSAARRWLLGYPGIHAVLADPSPAQLALLAEHLHAQPEIAGLIALRPRWSQQGQRLIEIEARLRHAAYHIQLPDGSRRYIARDGVLLPTVMPAPPDGAPLIRNLPEAGPEAFAFADALWQELLATDTGIAKQFPIIDLYWPLQHPIAAKQEYGVAFLAQHGAPFLFGRPDELQYGHSVEERVADLVHLIRCQGDPTTLAGAQLRFPKPRAMLARTAAPASP